MAVGNYCMTRSCQAAAAVEETGDEEPFFGI